MPMFGRRFINDKFIFSRPNLNTKSSLEHLASLVDHTMNLFLLKVLIFKISQELCHVQFSLC